MIMKNEMSVKGFNDNVETVKGFCYGNTLNAGGGFEMTVVARTRIRWISRMWRSFVWRKVFVKDERERKCIKLVSDQQYYTEVKHDV